MGRTGDSLPVHKMRLFQIISAEVMISPATKPGADCKGRLAAVCSSARCKLAHQG